METRARVEMEEIEGDGGEVEAETGRAGGDDWELELPAGMKGPPRGALCARIQIPVTYHGDPSRGVIEVVMWELSYREELLAGRRAKGEHEQMAWQRLRAAIRVIDGIPVNWATGAAEKQLDQLLDDVGQKARQLLLNAYARLFGATEDDASDFFGRVVTRTAG